jgi:hypothetical protein
MGTDFADKLKAALNVEEAADTIYIPDPGTAPPTAFKGTIQEAFNRYRAEYAGRDFSDPRGTAVTLREDNFPKLIKLRNRPARGSDRRSRAKAVLPALRNGTFDEASHFSEQPIRLRTLFWIEDVICHPDGIYPNCAALVDGEEVYIKRYVRESSSDVKMVFAAIGHAGQRIVITSFFDSAKRMHKYCDLPALYPAKK